MVLTFKNAIKAVSARLTRTEQRAREARAARAGLSARKEIRRWELINMWLR